MRRRWHAAGLRVFAAIAGVLRRRRAVGPDERIVTCGGSLRPLLVGIVVVSVIEIGVVDLLVPWSPYSPRSTCPPTAWSPGVGP